MPEKTDPIENKLGQLEEQYRQVKPAKDYGIVEPGEYLVQPKSAKLVESRNKGTPGLELMLEIQEGEHVGEVSRIVFWLTPGTLAYVKRDLARLGLGEIPLSELPKKNLPEICEAKLVRFGIEVDDATGREQNRIVRIREQISQAPKQPNGGKQ